MTARFLTLSCHPALSREARVALTLRVVGGLSSDEIARAFLVPAATVEARCCHARNATSARRGPASGKLRNFDPQGSRLWPREFGARPDPGTFKNITKNE